MTAQIIGALVRAILQVVGGVGLVSDDEINRAAGAAVVVLSFAWSLYQKYKAHRDKAVLPR